MAYFYEKSAKLLAITKFYFPFQVELYLIFPPPVVDAYYREFGVGLESSFKIQDGNFSAR